MSDLMTSPAIGVITDEETETGDGPMAHIVKAGPGESGIEIVMMARLEGTPVEALCGHVWVPSRDPKKLPMCQKCVDIYEGYKIANEGLDDVPKQ